jgi:C4-dicarboxylate-specific signal transduction histidine kinase
MGVGATIALVLIVILQLGLIAALLAQRRRRYIAEIAVQHRERRMDAILRAVPDLMFVLSPEGKYLDYHASDPGALYVPPDQFMGKYMRDVMPPELVRAFEPLLKQAMNGEEPVSLEYSLPIGGQEHYFEARIVRSGGDSIVAIIREVTENRRAQEQLHQTQSELVQAARLRSLAELATGIAHEVNQPLSAIITNARAGLRRIDGASDKVDLHDVREVLEDIVADGRRASDVITRIKGIVKQTPMRTGRIDVNDVIDEVIALSGRTLRQQHVRVSFQRGVDHPYVTADRVQLQQVLLNLVLNAADAMRAVDAGARMLEIRTERRNRGVTVTVHDSGPGLTESSVRRIFTPFFTTKTDGMGVGLSISRSIVEAHGGRLVLTSNSEEGATFEFDLPESPTSGVQPPAANR